MARRARLLPPLGESCGASGAAHRRVSRRSARSIVGCALYRSAIDELLAGLWTRLARGAVVCAARGAGRLRRRRIAACGGPYHRPLGPSARVFRGLYSRALRRRSRRVRRRSRPSSGRAALHLAGRHADSRARGAGPIHRARAAPDARLCRCAAAGLARGAVERRAIVMARKTSFYYSFLVLPAEQRRAIVAVWDFCRAVDDAVDEAPASGAAARSPREALCFWRAELARSFEGPEPESREGRGLRPFVAPSHLPRP